MDSPLRHPELPDTSPPPQDRLIDTAWALHLRALENLASGPLSRLTDRIGRPVTPRLRCAVLVWDRQSPGRKPAGRFRQVETPSPANGWRSRTVAQCDAALRVEVELVNVFAAVQDAGSREIVAAQMDGLPGTDCDARARHRTDALDRLGAIDRKLAAASTATPALPSVPPVACPTHGGNRSDMSRLLELFDAAEARVLPDPQARARPRLRRLHAFAGVAGADEIELVAAVETGAPGRFRTRAIRAHIRRRSDAAILAVCESAYALPAAGPP